MYKRDYQSVRLRRIEKYGYEYVMQYEKEARVRHRNKHGLQPPTMFHVPFHDRLVQCEGYTNKDALKICDWLRNRSRTEPFDKRLCHCSEGLTCSVCHLGHLREMFDNKLD